MIAKKTKEEALQAIRSGNTTGAIQVLEASELNEEKRRILTLIEAEYNELQSATLKGTISEDQRRSRSNQINDRLLTLLHDQPTARLSPNKKAYLLAGVGMVLALLAFLLIGFFESSDPDCPDFDVATKNRLLILPFEQVGPQTAQPHLLLRDRIETLVRKNDLSTSVGLGLAKPDLSIADAPAEAQQCAANAIVWGKYSKRSDSLRLVLQYHFANEPEANSASELISLKDVTSIHSGQFSQGLEDAIFALCAVIALRDGELELARKWLGKVKEKRALGEDLRGLIN